MPSCAAMKSAPGVKLLSGLDRLSISPTSGYFYPYRSRSRPLGGLLEAGRILNCFLVFPTACRVRCLGSAEVAFLLQMLLFAVSCSLRLYKSVNMSNFNLKQSSKGNTENPLKLFLLIVLLPSPLHFDHN